MTNLKYIIPLTAVSAFAFSSCDNIDENDRFIPVERPKIERVVLVQEFTGIRCVNCPLGASTIHDIQEIYPESVIAVCLHPEKTAYTNPYRGFSLSCKEATTYYNYFKPNGFPAAIIDGASPENNINQWSTLITSRLSDTAPLSISLDKSYNETTRELKVDYSVTFNQVYNNDCSILLWIMENGIVGYQLSGGKYIDNYVHNHVLRASINGDWGTELGNSFYPEDKVDGSATITLKGTDDNDKEGWNAQNCQVVAFVFQNSSKAVEQAAIINVSDAK